MECIFCNILNGVVATDFIYRDDKISVFTDINPKAPVHVLIVPEKHIESINSLTNEDQHIAAEMIMVAKKIAKDLGVEGGYKLVFNVGRKGGQLVDHLHLHMLGGWIEEKKELDIGLTAPSD